MRLSASGIEFIKKWEGVKLSPYLCSAGVPTIGVGHAILPNETFTTITEAEAIELFKSDIKTREDWLSLKLPKVTQNQFDACLSLLYNIGEGNFLKSSVLRCILQGKIPGAGDAFLLWNKAAGKVIKGLVSRRKAEREVFLNSIY